MRLNVGFAVAVLLVVVAAVTGAPAAFAQTDPSDDYAKQRFDVDPRGKIEQGGVELKPSEFFARAGRKDLVDKVKDAQQGSMLLGAGIGGGGCLGFLAGVGGFVGFTIVATTGTTASENAWAIPAGIASMGVGFLLLFGGIIGGVVVAALPQLSEPEVVDKVELQKIVDDTNAKTRARLGLPPKTAMRF